MSNIQKAKYCLKVILDKIFAFFLLIILSPVFIITSILIKIDSKGPVIFKQERLGKHGEIFNIYKFRTMCDNAVNMGSGIFVSKNDSRITRVGKLLRKTSLDELPQLINVLKGEMSFVGPRPPLVNHPYKYEEYNEKQKLRFAILPGITGYAQAYGRNSIRWPQRIKMDIHYFDNYSLSFDIKIIIATLFTVVSARGTYSDKSNTQGEK